MHGARRNYQELGFELFKGFFSDREIQDIREIVLESHGHWMAQNQPAVDKGAINSAFYHEALPNSVIVPHSPGDLLVFSAHLLHKGVYEKNRLSFDIIFASFKDSAAGEKANGHFPEGTMKAKIKNRQVFDLQ